MHMFRLLSGIWVWHLIWNYQGDKIPNRVSLMLQYLDHQHLIMKTPNKQNQVTYDIAARNTLHVSKVWLTHNAEYYTHAAVTESMQSANHSNASLSLSV